MLLTEMYWEKIHRWHNLTILWTFAVVVTALVELWVGTLRPPIPDGPTFLPEGI